MDKVVLFWFRRDLRLNDNAGLYQALVSKKEVLPFFLFDKNILDHLEDKADARVHFIHQQIASIKLQLQDLGSDILVDYGTPVESFKSIISNYPLSAVYTNRDYEPYALKRDKEVSDLLAENSISFLDFKDHVIFEKDEVLKENGEPYVVFTPYSKAWKKRLMFDPIKTFPSEEHWSEFQKQWKFPLPDIGTLGFGESDIPIPRKEVNQQLIVNYSKNRDYPALNGTSRLGIHFRFGSISMREKAKKASLLNETFLNELIWRDFYHMILFHFPKVAEESFKSDYDKIIWRNSESEFDSWCKGQTGYPLVDAGMRELNHTGFMHNRVRMVTASFLCKHLLIDWRWGAAYFASKLLDFDLASNNGGWQWAAGTGVDAAPYFRVFNPSVQQQKFDKDLKYIMKWVPEYGSTSYPNPIVEHDFARKRCLAVYKEALGK